MSDTPAKSKAGFYTTALGASGNLELSQVEMEFFNRLIAAGVTVDASGNITFGQGLTITGTFAPAALNVSGAGTIGTTLTVTGGQIAFPATQNASSGANTLDDYREGTWTPADNSGASLTLTITSAQYVKVGQLVICELDITYPATANGNNASISGLPFTSQGVAGYGGNLILPGSATAQSAQVNPNATTLRFVNNAGGLVPNSTLSTKQVAGVIVYRATT